MKAREVFRYELNQITDLKLRRQVIKTIKKMLPEDTDFWVKSASSTGMYHPKVSLGRGGLIRHIKLAIWWAHRLFEQNSDLLRSQKDHVIAALLLHDICKHNGTTTKNHGIVAARQLRALPAKDKLSREIIDAVALHMGQWTDWAELEDSDEEYDQLSPVTKITHLADYLASCKVDRFLGELENDYRP